MPLATSSLAAAGTITTDSGNDILVGSGRGDIIRSGAGNDQVRPGAGNDIIDLGTGSDIVDLEDLVAGTLTSANRVNVTGFTADGNAYTASNEVDAFRFGNVTTTADIIIAYQSGNAYIFFGNEGADADAGVLDLGEIALIDVVNGVTMGGFVNSNFQ